MIPRSDWSAVVLYSLVYHSRACEPILKPSHTAERRSATTRANAERIRAASRRYYHRGPPVTLPAVSELGGQDRHEAISERGIPAPCLAWRSRGN